MKKYEHIFIFILAITLMLLASCRTTKTVETERHEAVVHSLAYQDSLHHQFDFRFDCLDYWILDSAQIDSPRRDGTAPRTSQLKHIRITNGIATQSTERLRRQEQTDSVGFKAQEVIHPVRVPPKRHSTLIAILIIALIMLFLINRSRTR